MRKWVDRFLERLLLTVLIVMLLAVIWQVISRYLFSSPSTLTDEIASFGLIWLGLYGAAYCTGKGLHLSIDLLPRKFLSKSPLFFEGMVVFCVVFFALLVLVVGGLQLCYLTFILGQRSAVLEVSLSFIYSAIPLSGILIIYYSLEGFLRKLKSRTHG